MRKELLYAKNICLTVCFWWTLFGLSVSVRGYAQEPVAPDMLTRYVAMDGKYGNDGLSWNSAKNQLQNAINELHSYMTKNGIKEGGRVFVKAGTYTPNESTEAQSGSVLNTSFKIYEGIVVYGGFAGTESSPNERVWKPGFSAVKHGWEYANPTILSGNHASTDVKFTWDQVKQEYTTIFPGNSYHVVWFATNGFTTTAEGRMRANALNATAGVDGCIIEGGFAKNTTMNEDKHSAFGGGAYMVKNSYLRHCEVRYCEATRRGAGVFLDGGGLVERCYVHTNQCKGIGGYEGYGGGVAINDYGGVHGSLIVNNMARIGGGIALNYEQTELAAEKNLAIVTSVIANNTSAQEAGGVFFNKGGSANRLTVVRNRCNGQDITIKRIRYGRSAGAYVLENGHIYNSVFWGGQVGNRNIQFAVHNSSGNNENIRINYSAFEYHDITDWNATEKMNVWNLESENSRNVNLGDNYAAFDQPTSEPGVMADENGTPIAYTEQGVSWSPKSISALRGKSVQMVDLTCREEREQFMHLEEEHDVHGTPLKPLDAIGAFAELKPTVQHALVNGVNTLFVDPTHKTLNAETVGMNWENALNNLNDALEYFKTHELGTTPRQILVKEGLLTSVGYYKNNHLRSSSINMVSNVTVKGGYASSLTGTAMDLRNPAKYRTVISGNLTEDSYINNACHLVVFENTSNAVLDGFHLSFGNAASTALFDTDPAMQGKPMLQDGAGIVCWNKILKGEEQPAQMMRDNVVRNCVISNCTALLGSAALVHAQPTTSVNLTLENCIIHNNESKISPTEVESGAIRPKVKATIFVESLGDGATATVTMNHCNIMKNVGHPLVTSGKNASVQINNSVVWANTSEPMSKLNLLAAAPEKVLRLADPSLQPAVNLVATSSCCIVDQADAMPANVQGKPILTYQAGDVNFPDFVNPTKNIAVNEQGDLTVYGGLTDHTPLNMNPLVNEANVISQTETDFQGNTRNYGGLPDVGAVENTNLPEGGRVIYVRDYGDPNIEGGNGSSWSSAINGNRVYTNNHGFQGVDAELYAENKQLTGLQWAVDEAFYRSLKKKDDGTILYTEPSSIEGHTVYSDHSADFSETETFKAKPIRISEVVEDQLVQVWLGSGTYTRSEGFFMRNSVDVFGGFPVTGNPAMKERNPKEYPTIIQTNEDGVENWGPKRGDALGKAGDNVAFSNLDKAGWTATASNKNGSVDASVVIDGDPNNVFNGSFPIDNQDTGCNLIIDFHKDIEFNYLTIDQIETDSKVGIQIYAQKSGSVDWIYIGKEYNFSWGGDSQSINSDFPNGKYSKFKIWIYYTGSFSGEVQYSFKEIILKKKETFSTHYDLNAYDKAAYVSRRVLTQPYPYYAGNGINTDKGNGNMEWDNVPLNYFGKKTYWDGLIIQNGRTQISHQRDGGAGVALRHNGCIINCIVRNNKNKAPSQSLRGGGVFCNGGEIINCVIESNEGTIAVADGSSFGGGLYLRLGTVFNTCFAKNKISRNNGAEMNNQYTEGSAVFFENGVFYNNTVVGNEGNHAVKTGNYFRNGKIDIYNSILYDNINKSGKDLYVDTNNAAMSATISHCLFSNENAYFVSGVTPTGMVWGNPKLNADFRLQSSSPAINAGLLDPGGVTLPTFDADYTDRVKDCVVDIGAFEYDGSQNIQADEDAVAKTACYYVTQNGSKSATANSPATAACARKLQQVLYAAGKLKLDHPDYKVTVKLAGNSAGIFYQPTQSSISDESNPEYGNPRNCSLMIPKGIIVEGGWNQNFTGERDIKNNKVILEGLYQDVLAGLDVKVYHTVTFVDQMFVPRIDIGGFDEISLQEVKDDAVLDGLYLQGGHATGETVENQYGGAAVVPAFAHVRNCILENNEASNGGGALYLKTGALVSGCIFKNNVAGNGGAVMVEQLDDKDVVKENQVHIYTSTFVSNTARKAGGGIWFYNNVRVNSSVFWRNLANTQADVAGKYENSSGGFGVDDFPFAYSAVENLRLPGVNNQEVATNNDNGVRFAEVDGKIDELYGLTDYSILVRQGMPIEEYQILVGELGLTPNDLCKIKRYGPEGDEINENKYIDVGARSLGKRSIVVPTATRVLNRLFVTYPDKVNMTHAQEVIDYVKGLGAGVEIPMNALQGGSFAYPMQTLDDALNYIIDVRKNTQIPLEKKAKFEIFISGGTFFPMSTIAGIESSSRQSTFLVPEGVTIVGGVDPNDTKYGYYCQENGGQTPETWNGVSFRLEGADTHVIADRRELYDLNSNDIYEPWEMLHQTILSGRNINKEGIEAVYHVITIVPQRALVGQWPDEKKPQPIILDGLQIMDGYAWNDTIIMDSSRHPLEAMSYFTGGGIYANGINDMINNPDGTVSYDFRAIPLRISHCRFLSNTAGWGGAIMSNVPTEISASSFEQNLVRSKSASKDLGTDIKGLGAAIYSANELQIANSLFANNEARDNLKPGGTSRPFNDVYGAGTISSFNMGTVVMMNCNVVNNKANKYPAIFTQQINDKACEQDTVHHNVILNSLFWGNEAVDASVNETYQHVINYDIPGDLEGSQESLWFCAYEEGRGRKPVNHADFRAAPIPYFSYVPNTLGENNCNIIISSDNSALNGPNFTHPSLGAGVDKFMVTANWLPFRQNNLTDNGWTYLKQKITNDAEGNYVSQFVDAQGNPVEGEEGLVGAGAYFSYHGDVVKKGFGNFGVPLGATKYMQDKSGKVMHRISLDPNPSHEQTYIDVGLYEYQHIQLNIRYGEAIDTLWVSEQERPENGTADGSRWEQPTSDLQRAIETLLCSRNGHGKVICLMQGNYHPVYFFDNNLGFRIDTKSLNESVITKAEEAYKGIEGLTISGGWNVDIAYTRDVEQCPTSISMSSREGIPAEQMKYLFDVANIQQYYGRDLAVHTDGSVIPLTLDGLTFVNNRGALGAGDKGGAAVYYQSQKVDAELYQGNEPLKSGQLCAAPQKGLNKLNLANCIFMDNGLNAEIPTVVIEQGGGKTLLKNSLFHSNRGASLLARDFINVVNCTFALNGGNVQLTHEKSSMYANVLWRNNQDVSFRGQPEAEIVAATNFIQNALTDPGKELGRQVESSHWVLSDDNEDLQNGPNFVRPFLEAKTAEEISQRDFHLNPSMALLNRAGDLYWKYVDPKMKDAVVDEVGDSLIKAPFAQEMDLSSQPRLFGKRMELGAYEYQLPLQRIIYVDPLVQISGNGKSWEFAYSGLNLQKAMDMAAVYAHSNHEQGYVYVKARNDRENIGLTLTMRDGVSVYGSLPNDFVDEVKMQLDGTYLDEDVRHFEQKIRMERAGMAIPGELCTTVGYVKANGEYHLLSVLDGFVISGKGLEGNPDYKTKPAVHLTSRGLDGQQVATHAPIVLRNSIVHDYHNDGVPVVQVDNGLLYNVLLRDNTISGNGAMVKFGRYGWALNSTFATEKPGYRIVEEMDPDHVLHCVEGAYEGNPTFTPCLRRDMNLPAYKTKDWNTRFQLADNSPDLNQLELVDFKGKTGLPSELEKLICYETDRDLLGNPRAIGNVDNGCYETWNVEANTTVMAKMKNVQDWKYALRFAPSKASVVYLHEKANLVFQPFGTGDPATALPENYLFQPCYLKMRLGSSLYGNGQPIKLDYLTVDKKIEPLEKDGQVWSLMALPFDFDLQRLTKNEFVPLADVKGYAYNGERRAKCGYRLASVDSKCWELMAPGPIERNRGFLMHIPEVTDPLDIFHFTAIAPVEFDFVYTEDATPKSVSLQQFNALPADGSANFTAMENMGWNMMGMPYLVGHYLSGAEETAGTYPMNFPHVLYGLDGATGNYQVKRSWDPDATWAMAEGYLTQTATLDNSETVTFALPVYVPAEPIVNPANRLRLTSGDGMDEIEIYPSAEVQKLTYGLGTDGLKWMAVNPHLPQIYLQNEVGTRFALAGAAPVEKDLKLGIRVAKEGIHTFALPQRADFADFSHVWLTDHVTGKVTDLKVADYSVALTGVGVVTDRFTLKFGGTAPVMDDASGARYSVFVRNGLLHVRGLDGGERIEVFDMAGRRLLSVEATPHEFTVPLKVGVYVVKVNGNVYKVR